MQGIFRGIQRYISNTIGIDYRSLAFFRICIAAVIIIDIGNRWTDIPHFYSSGGVLPVSDFINESRSETRWSLYFANDSELFVTGMFSATILFAFGMLVGYRTRLCVIVSWVLLASLHSRNFLVLQSGDTMLRVLLFWSMFLPMARVWSVDALRMKVPTPGATKHVSFGSLALLGQVVIVYVFTGLLKTGDPWIKDFSALYYALSLEHFARPAASHLTENHELSMYLTSATLFLEIYIPLLLLAPVKNGYFRFFVVLSFVTFHMGIISLMYIGTFSLVGISAWMAFLPSELWDKWLPTLSKLLPVKLRDAVARMRKDLCDRFSGGSGTAGAASPDITIGSRPARTRVAITYLQQGFLAVAFVTVLLWNIRSLDHYKFDWYFRQPVRNFLYTADLSQEWKMFAPKPLTYSFYITTKAQLFDGREVEIFHRNSDLIEKPPESVFSLFKSYRWRKYLSNISKDKYEDYRLYLGKYLTRQWNNTHHWAEKAETFQIYRHYKEIPKMDEEGPSEYSSRVLWRHRTMSDKRREEYREDLIERGIIPAPENAE